MAKKQTLIHLHGNTPFNAPSTIQHGELVIEHGTGADKVKMHTISDDSKLATFITEAAIDAKLGVVGEDITTLSSAVATLNGEETVDGSVKKALKDAKDYADGLATNYDAAGAAAQALSDAKTYAETKASAAQTAAEKTATDLNTAMDTRVKALEAIDHDHANKEVLDGITAVKVAAWDGAEAAAKKYAEGLNTTTEGKITTLQGEVDAIDAKIGEGFSNTDTVAKAVAAAKTTVSAASGSVIKVTSSTVADGHSNYELSLEGIASSSDLSTLQNQVSTLIGSDSDMSARAIVQDEVAKQLESENISDSFDTLKEMAEYLSSHPATVTEMNNAISDNTKNITTLSGAVATLNGEETVDGSVKKALKDAKNYADGLNTAMDARVDVLEAIDHDAYIAADTVLQTNITNTINNMKITLPNGDVSLVNNKFDLSTMTIDCGTY